MSAAQRLGVLAAVMLLLLPASAAGQSIDIGGFLTLEGEWQELELSDGRVLPIADTATGVKEEQFTIPFERAEVRLQNLCGRWLNLSLGQLRDPFGHWEDFSSHRNATLTKNNEFVLGIALRNLDMGITADGDFTDWLDYRLGIRKGNNVATTDLGREDNNGRYDAVGRFGVHNGSSALGFNAYFVDSRSDKFALGADWQTSIAMLTLMGEGVLQRNQPDGLRSLATYVQANFNLARRVTGLRWFVLCDYWRLEADSRLEREALSLDSGFKYKLPAGGLTLILELGRTYVSAAPDPWHVTGQMEVEF
ncbi:MAG: hypothetical protein HZB43_08640 [candidate division Zixibacteria bacterium]|nr:hypothetical protein [candidate division Zixibacteria bacterium]